MYKNKLFPLLSRLNQRELTAFEKCLTQHFTRQDIPSNVFRYVRNFHPHYREADVHPPAIHSQLFASEPYNKGKVHTAYSEIFQQLRDFLLSEKVKKDRFQYRYTWISVLEERGLYPTAREEAAELRKEVEELPGKDVTDYLKGIEAWYYFTYLTNRDRQKADIDALKGYVNNLDTYYAVCRLKVACELLNLEQQYPNNFSFATLPPLVDSIVDEQQADHPLLLCYKAVYQLLATSEVQYFDHAEMLLTQHIDHIATPELHTIISYLHNYAFPRVRDGVREFQEKVHHINVMALDCQVFAEKGTMSNAQFNNIVHVACKVRDYDWAERFIFEQRQYMETTNLEATVELAKATYYFEQQLFHEATLCLEVATAKDTKEVFHEIRANVLKLSGYYELNPEHDQISPTCERFEQYLYDKRARMEPIMNSVLRFIRILRMLCKSESSRDSILNTINLPLPVANREWLLEKANQYKPKYAVR